MRWLLVGLVGFALAAEDNAAKPISAYCYDNCSNHGQCVDNICHCEPGYHGENCATNFGLPPLSQGSFNLTSKAAASAYFASHPAVLVGVSMQSCAKCAAVESEYAEALKTLKVPLARVDAAKHADVLAMLGLHATTTMPQIVLVWDEGRRFGLYRGSHNASELVRFAENKATGKGYAVVLEPPSIPRNEFIALFLFSSRAPADSSDSDEWEDMQETAASLRAAHAMHVAAIVAYAPARAAARRPWDYVGALPAVVVLSGSGQMLASASLSERLMSPDTRKPVSLVDYLSAVAVPLVTELTPESFATAELAGLPMLIVFFPDADAMDTVMEGLELAAREFRGKITFLHALQSVYKVRMSALRLGPRPHTIMAFNTKEMGPVPFPDDECVDAASIRRFCIEYLAGRLKPVSETAAVRDAEAAADAEEPDVRGVSETYYAHDTGLWLVETQAEWEKCAMDETLDAVVVVFKSRGCKDCKTFAPYVKRVAARFTMLPGHNVVVCAVDFLKVHPKLLWDVAVPSMLVLPAFAKSPPLRFYSGMGKVFPMMEWVRINAGHAFEWSEELPQFDAEQKRLFKEQIKEREEKRAEL